MMTALEKDLFVILETCPKETRVWVVRQFLKVKRQRVKQMMRDN